MKRMILLASAAAVMLPVMVIAAAPTGLPAVPAGLSPQATSQLTNERAKLVAQGQALQVKVEKHHSECAHIIGLPVPSPSPEFVALEKQCEAEAAQLETETKQYAAASAAYRKDVEQATVSGSAGSAAFAVRVVLKNDAKLIKASGQSTELVSSRVVQMSSGDRLSTGPHSRLACQLPDKTQFTLGPETDISLAKFQNAASPSGRHISLRVSRGVLAWQNVDIAGVSSQDISIALTAGTVTIKGAQVQVSLSSAGDGYVALRKGAVTIAAKNGASVALAPGQVVRFDSRGVFASATPLASGEIKTP